MVDSQVLTPDQVQQYACLTTVGDAVSAIGSTDELLLVVEAHLVRDNLSAGEVASVVEYLKQALEPQPSALPALYYHKLRVLRVVLEKLPNFDLIVLASYHCNPHVPWSSPVNAELVRNTPAPDILQYIESLRPNLLVLPKPSKALHGGLAPRLGYGGAKREIHEEDARGTWKLGPKVKAVAMEWFLILLIGEGNWFDTNWPVVTSFILNLGDDHEPRYKLQACKLLVYLLLQLERTQSQLLHKSGLLEGFVAFTRSCLSNMTLDTTLPLISDAFPCLLRLLDMKNDPLKFVDVINSNILAPVSTLIRSRERLDTAAFLVDQITAITAQHIHGSILVSFSRINFTLSQTITDPYLIDSTEGLGLIEASLRCQRVVMDEVNDREILASYQYDLIGAWIVLKKRLGRMEASGSIVGQLAANIARLQELGLNEDLKDNNEILQLLAY